MSDDDILDEFIIEAREIIDQLDVDFVKLEETPEDIKLIRNIFRAVHTLKGNSGFFSFKRLEKVCHAAEAMLGKLRDGVIALDASKTTSLLFTLDTLREIIAGIEKDQKEPAGNDSALIKDLLSLASGQELTAKARVAKTETVPVHEEVKQQNRETIVEPSLPTSHFSEAVLAAPPNNVLSPQRTAESGERYSTENGEGIHSEEDESSKHQDLVAPVKVNLALLNELMSLVSEMVLARNRLLPFSTEFSDQSFSNAVRTIDLLTQALQERMMKTRMQPISQVWAKFPRLVRDVANECNKKVSLLQEGTETELDRSLLDAIRDPLVHMIRNSIDHGLETPEDRIKAGKSEVGKLLLKASHENGMVVMTIADDGAGINFESVRKKAVSSRLVTAQEAKNLQDDQLLALIFEPGFSTKDTASNLSGRGVGMDVVKTNISNIGGSIDIESLSGMGTTIRVKIPLTVAIMPALFVRSNAEQYAIPQNSIVELVRLDLSTGEKGLEDFYGTPVFRLRDSLVPLLYLYQQLEFDHDSPEFIHVINIVILQSSGIRFGLIVDEVLNIQEIVVKPLGPLFKEISDFGGATILGDGRVALILDVDGIATQSGLVAKIQSRPLNDEHVFTRVEGEDQVSMLLFALQGLENLAIPLDLVKRLEMIAPNRIQKNGNRHVVQYDGQIMELLYLESFVSGAKAKDWSGEETISVIVHNAQDVPIGLVVSQIHDIINTSKDLHAAIPAQKGLLGCVSLGESVINVINVDEILAMHRMTYVKTQYSVVAELSETL